MHGDRNQELEYWIDPSTWSCLARVIFRETLLCWQSINHDDDEGRRKGMTLED
jgi:hypothetical protein